MDYIYLLVGFINVIVLKCNNSIVLLVLRIYMH